MKTYGNGPQGMRYGGMNRKPMMYGGGISAGIKSFKGKKPKKKQMGGMINNTMSTGMNQMPNPMMGKTMMAKGGTPFGRLSVEAGIDKNPNPTQADRIAGATKNKKRG